MKQILRLPSGIPSHDTINRVFGMINARHFERLFSEWADELKDSGTLERVVAIDGKTACVSRDTFHSKSPVHLVHAWSVENGLCLGQYRTATKNNEITAIPELLDILDIAGSIVTIDAMETQTTITKKIIECKADYILAVKGNQGELREEVETVCNRHRPASDTTETEKGHGRIETRRCQVFGKGLTVDPEVRWRACSRRWRSPSRARFAVRSRQRNVYTSAV